MQSTGEDLIEKVAETWGRPRPQQPCLVTMLRTRGPQAFCDREASCCGWALVCDVTGIL